MVTASLGYTKTCDKIYNQQKSWQDDWLTSNESRLASGHAESRLVVPTSSCIKSITNKYRIAVMRDKY